MAVVRVPNYDIKIVQYAKSLRGSSLVWGDTDCASVVRGGLVILLGKDPLPDLKSWSGLKSAKNRANEMPVPDRLINSGAIEVHRKFSSIGDVAVGPSSDIEELPQLSMVLTNQKILISTQEFGVQIVPFDVLVEDTRFFRYE